LNVSGVSPSFPTMKVPFTVTPVFWCGRSSRGSRRACFSFQLRASMPSRTAAFTDSKPISTWRQPLSASAWSASASSAIENVGLREPLEVQGLHGLEELARPAAPHERVVVGELDERVLPVLADLVDLVHGPAGRASRGRAGPYIFDAAQNSQVVRQPRLVWTVIRFEARHVEEVRSAASASS